MNDLRYAAGRALTCCQDGDYVLAAYVLGEAIQKYDQLEAQRQLKLAPDNELAGEREACVECRGEGLVQIKDGIYGVCPGCWGGGE